VNPSSAKKLARGLIALATIRRASSPADTTGGCRFHHVVLDVVFIV
jgi:hypothetical protein